MSTSGAALHDHEVIDSGTIGKGRALRWCLLCSCGEKSLGMTLSAACEQQRAHARYVEWLDADSGYTVLELLLSMLAGLAWALVIIGAGHVIGTT